MEIDGNVFSYNVSYSLSLIIRFYSWSYQITKKPQKMKDTWKFCLYSYFSMGFVCAVEGTDKPINVSKYENISICFSLVILKILTASWRNLYFRRKLRLAFSMVLYQTEIPSLAMLLFCIVLYSTALFKHFLQICQKNY
jgi:hypothetical protein